MRPSSLSRIPFVLAAVMATACSASDPNQLTSEDAGGSPPATKVDSGSAAVDAATEPTVGADAGADAASPPIDSGTNTMTAAGAVTASSDGTSSNGTTRSDPVLSSDGRFVAFTSDATNLVAGASGLQVYVKDRVSGAISVASSDASGTPMTSAHPIADSISRDGRFVLIESYPQNDDAGTSVEFYLKDLQSKAFTKIAYPPASANPTPAQSFVRPGALSDDGAWVVLSIAYVKHSGGTHVFRYPTNALNAPVQVDTPPQASSGVDSFAYSNPPRISADGRFVVWHDLAAYKASDGTVTEGPNQVFIKDMQMNTAKSVTGPGGAVPWRQLVDITLDASLIMYRDELQTMGQTQPFSAQQLYIVDANSLAVTPVFDSAHLTTLSAEPALPLDAHLGNDGKVVVFSSTAHLVSGMNSKAGSYAYRLDRSSGAIDVVRASGSVDVAPPETISTVVFGSDAARPSVAVARDAAIAVVNDGSGQLVAVQF